jgi:hypothetical protein
MSILVAVQNETKGVEVDTLFHDVPNVHIIWPKKQMALQFSRIIVLFDPMTAPEQRFIHQTIERHLSPGGKVVYGMV